MDIALDRLGVLLNQLDSARDLSQPRLADLVDDEYLWEPVRGCWSVRRRGENLGAQAYGPGD